MFNENLKLKYLETKKELTREQYQNFYIKTATFENRLSKDLHEFTLEEILNMINEIHPKNDSQEKMYRSFVSGYVNWAIDQGIRSNNINPLLMY